MKKYLLFIGLAITSSANAQVVVGPLSDMTMCPSPAHSQTKGRSKYCIFDDPVIQVIQARCPYGVPGAVQSTAGRNTWCVIKR